MKNYEITGCVSSNVAKYRDYDKNHEFPVYDILATVNLGIIECSNLDEARDWFENNYPTLMPGGSIIEVEERKDFILFAVKGCNEHWGIDDIHANNRKVVM